jgi:hypothetical protein
MAGQALTSLMVRGLSALHRAKRLNAALPGSAQDITLPASREQAMLVTGRESGAVPELKMTPDLPLYMNHA